MEYAGILAQLAATAHRFLMRLQGTPAQQVCHPNGTGTNRNLQLQHCSLHATPKDCVYHAMLVRLEDRGDAAAPRQLWMSSLCHAQDQGEIVKFT